MIQMGCLIPLNQTSQSPCGLVCLHGAVSDLSVNVTLLPGLHRVGAIMVSANAPHYQNARFPLVISGVQIVGVLVVLQLCSAWSNPVMCPCRGKTFLCNKLVCYLNWLGHQTKLFNVGSYRCSDQTKQRARKASAFHTLSTC